MPSMALDAVGGRRGRTQSSFEIRSTPAVALPPAVSMTPPRSAHADSTSPFREVSPLGAETDHILIPEDGEILTSVDFDLISWLNFLHMSRYEPTFRKNGFDTREAVQLLSEDDLDLMGIRIQRHRALLLRESARLL